MKKGILLLAYGGPNKRDDIAPFYRDIRMSYAGVEPTQEMIDELIEEYDMIGGYSPLLEITENQAESLRKELNYEYPVYIGMRHWEPWIHETMKQMKEDGIEEAVSIIMAPHFSRMSVCKYYERVNEALEWLNYDLKLHRVKSWHTHPEYIKGVAERVKEGRKQFSDDIPEEDVHYLFTAHSLPAKVLEYYGPYPKQLRETCELLSQELGHNNWSFSFQSAGKSRMPWLGPDILEHVHTLADQGQDKVLTTSIGFIADHFEIINDIDIEAKPEAHKRNMTLERSKTLNDSPYLARTLADVVQQYMPVYA
jgi:ferrochelatase